MKIVDDDTVFDNRNDDNDVPDGRSKANTMMTTMDLDNYEPSYDSYALFHTATRVNNYSNNIISLRKTYPEAYQGQGSAPSPTDVAGRISESFNQSNHSMPV